MSKYIQLPLRLFVQLHPDIIPFDFLLVNDDNYIVRYLPDFSLVEVGYSGDSWKLG